LISENAADVIWMWDLEEGRCLYQSPSVEQLRGFSPEEIIDQPMDQAMPGDTCRRIAAETESRRAAVESGDESARIRTNEVEYFRKDGTTVTTETVTKLVSDARGKVRFVIGVSRDITELKRAEAAKAKIENELRQAQKLESVGRLAAGVAHDFNNLLTVINGYSRLLLGSLKEGDPLRGGLEEIHKAGERAAALTQQLLAFSRKQMLQPRVLDLNRVVDQMRPMLERLMGEDVEVCVNLQTEAATICADPNQLEQVLMNLAANSRDAMPHGGKFSIETGFVEWGESHAQLRPGTHAGPCVMLAVSDTGEGMDEETRGHIFEPFFTTKEVGKGTGLGLSTIYGIVEQSGGHIEVASELGRGTTFKIYMPRVVGAQPDSGKPEAAAAMGGRETVLVVEDHAEVREYAAAALGAYGYQVMEAANAEEALLLCDREGERIDLILTDVVMPGLSGRELADRLKQCGHGIKVLFMSGYTGDIVLHHGVLQKEAEFIQKPFGPDQLARKVREMLMAPVQRSGGATA
jgi:PAS domain S-box-containing protein